MHGFSLTLASPGARTLHWLVLGHCMNSKPSLYMQIEFYALASHVWCCMSPKPSLYSHAEFYIHCMASPVWCRRTLYESKTFTIYMQSSMDWLVLYALCCRTLYESKTFTIHAEFYMHWLVLYGGHCMNPKPSLYMQSSICTG